MTTRASKVQTYRLVVLQTTALRTRSYQLLSMGDSDINVEINYACERDTWGDRMEEIFIDMLYYDTLRGTICGGKITVRDHANYATRLSQANPNRIYVVGQIKGKLERLRRTQRKFTDLLNQSGMSWDPVNKMIVGSDESWEHAIKVKSDWRKFRTHGCPKYEELCAIFGGSVATGSYRHASTQGPRMDNDHTDQVGEQMEGGLYETPHPMSQPMDFEDLLNSMGPGLGGCAANASSSRPTGPRSQRGSPAPLHPEVQRCIEEVIRTQAARRKSYEDRVESGSLKRSRGVDLETENEELQ